VGNPLAVALGHLDLSIEAIREAAALDPGVRTQLLDDLGHVATGIEQAPSQQLGAGRPFEVVERGLDHRGASVSPPVSAALLPA